MGFVFLIVSSAALTVDAEDSGRPKIRTLFLRLSRVLGLGQYAVGDLSLQL